MTMTPNPSHPILAASTLAARFQNSIKLETAQYHVLKDVHYFDKFEIEYMTLAHVHDIHQVFHPKYVPGTQEERVLFAEKLLCLCLSIAFKLMLVLHLSKSITRIARHQNVGVKFKINYKSTRADLVLMSLQDKLFSTWIDSHLCDVEIISSIGMA